MDKRTDGQTDNANPRVASQLKNTEYIMTSGKKVGGARALTKTKFQEKNQNLDKFFEGVDEKIFCYNLKPLIFCF